MCFSSIWFQVSEQPPAWCTRGYSFGSFLALIILLRGGITNAEDLQSKTDLLKGFTSFRSLVNEGDTAGALQQVNRMIALSQRTLGRTNSQTALWHRRKAALLSELGDIEPAVVELKTAQEIFDLKNNGVSTEGLRNMADMCSLIVHISQPAQSEEWLANLKQRIELCRAQDLDQVAEFAYALNQLGLIHLKREEYLKAIKVFEESCVIAERIFGTKHPETAIRLSNLANVYYLSGFNLRSNKFYQCVLSIYEDAYGKDHIKTINTLYDIGVNCLSLYSNEVAVNIFQVALSRGKKALPDNDPSLRVLAKNMAITLRAVGEIEGAVAIENEFKLPSPADTGEIDEPPEAVVPNAVVPEPLPRLVPEY